MLNYWNLSSEIGKIYSANLRIQSEYRKIRTRKNCVFGHFSRSARDMNNEYIKILGNHYSEATTRGVL